MSSVLGSLSSSLGRRDEVPNKDLAIRLAGIKDSSGIGEIVENLQNKDKNIQSDCIKVLDELSSIDPSRVLPHIREIARLLESRNNRLQWGAMSVLDNICDLSPDLIYKNLEQLLIVAEKGLVITKDHLMSILLKLCRIKTYSGQAHVLFLEQLLKSLPNQLPMYAEQAAGIIEAGYRPRFLHILETRLGDIEKASKQQRIQKVIRKLGTK